MGTGDRNPDASESTVDGWFDLLDGEAEPPGEAPSGVPARGSGAPVNLAGLDEISRKITPVMLTPVTSLAPIEPAGSARDAWDDDLTPDPFAGSLRGSLAANQARGPSSAPALPALLDGEDEHGQEFLEFGEAPGAAFTFVTSTTASSAPTLPVTPYGAAPERAAPSSERSFDASLPPAGRVAPLRRGGALQGISEPPRKPTLVGQSVVAPPPMPADDDGFDLSDFDRWGDAEPPPATLVQSVLTDGSEFVSPPDSAGFSEAVTLPRIGPSTIDRGARMTPEPTPEMIRPSTPLDIPPSIPPPAPRSGEGPRGVTTPPRATMSWSDAPTPVLGTAVQTTTPRRPPPLPPSDPPARPAAGAPSPLPPARRSSPRQEMHERLDVGDFSAALAIAETLLEVDSADEDASHVAAVCRAKLKAILLGRLGSLAQVPVLAVSPGKLRGLTLDHRSGFLLSLIDGFSSLEEIVDIAGMPPLEALRTLADFVAQRVVTLRAP
jgi:hypothetical protein